MRRREPLVQRFSQRHRRLQRPPHAPQRAPAACTGAGTTAGGGAVAGASWNAAQVAVRQVSQGVVGEDVLLHQVPQVEPKQDK